MPMMIFFDTELASLVTLHGKLIPEGFTFRTCIYFRATKCEVELSVEDFGIVKM